MAWLGRLTFEQAIRWALVWPVLLIAAIAVSVGVATALSRGGDWAFGWNFEAGPMPAWLAGTILLGAVLLGPSLVFLILWKVARR
jgi:hypothetical protein